MTRTWPRDVALVDARDWGNAPISEHLDAYLAAPLPGRKGGRRTKRRLDNIRRDVTNSAHGLGWISLSNVDAEEFLQNLEHLGGHGIGGQRRADLLMTWKSFLNWCVCDGRPSAHPLTWKRPKAGRDLRKSCSLSKHELDSLFRAALRRPLHEARLIRRGSRQGQLAAPVTPVRCRELRMVGRERALAYRLKALTGLRSEEAAAVRIGDVPFGEHPAIHLDGSRTKNGREAVIPLRRDVAEDLAEWIALRLEEEREVAAREGEPAPASLDLDRALLRVPSCRVFASDAKHAGLISTVPGETNEPQVYPPRP
ncbi:MAG: site-specific recombinase XerC [Planctomycetota bacterium]|jgi:site-specific recombinase XerC